MNMNMNILKDFLLDAPTRVQLGFQDAASPVMEGLVDLHHSIMFFLVIIFCFVLWMMVQIYDDYAGRDLNYNVIHRYMPIVFLKEYIINYISVITLTHGVMIEIIWTLIPTFILIIIAIPSFALLYSMDEVIDPELTIKVIGHQWFWSYEYSDFFDLFEEDLTFDSYMIPDKELKKGDFRLLEVDNQVVLPAETHIRVLITASDVLHAWAVPSLAVKMDAVPGRLNQTSIYIKREGLFYGQCSELCGVNHGFMPIVIRSVSVRTFIDWIFSHYNGGEVIDFDALNAKRFGRKRKWLDG